MSLAGATDVYLMGADDPTHAVDVTDSLPTGVESLRPIARASTDSAGTSIPSSSSARSPRAGAALGMQHAVAFGRIQLQGV